MTHGHDNHNDDDDDDDDDNDDHNQKWTLARKHLLLKKLTTSFVST